MSQSIFCAQPACVILSGQTAALLPAQDARQSDELVVHPTSSTSCRADSAWDDDRWDDAVDLYKALSSIRPLNVRHRLGWCYNNGGIRKLLVLKNAVQLDPSTRRLGQTALRFGVWANSTSG
jgi:hypothetical protein